MGLTDIAGVATEDEASARVLDALAGAPADPDELGRRLGLRPDRVATIVARLVVRGKLIAAGDGRLARR